ncbi:hypothetical protein [Deinococcus seoulensis]|nr:hypothetical protein [Deinococcus seoulensis]
MSIEQFQGMKAQGADPLEVARAARAQGAGPVEIIRLLRSLFELPFAEAKELATRVVFGLTLDQYQQRFIAPLLEELEREGL